MCLTASASRTGHGMDSRSNTPPPQLRTFILTIVAERPASRRHKSSLTCVYQRLQDDRRHSASWPQGVSRRSFLRVLFSADPFSGDVLEADFWTARMSAPILTPAHDNVLYHSLSALASAEVNFWFTCRRKRLVSRADGCGEKCRMTFLATSASAYT